jgi:hypothetical protein
MKRVLLVLGFMVALPLLAATVAQAQPGTSAASSLNLRPIPRPNSVPEIDPMVAGSILTFLAGGMFLMDGRIRNKARARK